MADTGIERPNINQQLLTMDDLEHGAPVKYDAMVLFADANQNFVDEMTEVMKTKGLWIDGVVFAPKAFAFLRALSVLFRDPRVDVIHGILITLTIGAMADTGIERPNINQQLLTMDDLEHGAPVKYDAMVLFADANQNFVDEMTKVMKTKGLWLFTGYRNDLVPGDMPHSMVCELIASRCHNIIVIYSPEFFSNDMRTEEGTEEADKEVAENRYYAAYALATKIASKGEHRMIPCVYEECTLPEVYRHNHMLYCKSDAYNFYDHLAKVLRRPRSIPSSSVPMIAGRKDRRVSQSVGERVRRWCRNVSRRFKQKRPQLPQAIQAN